jgi:hypothetical protein
VTNHRKRQMRDVDRDDDKDERPCDAPNFSGSPVPDSAAPVLQSEDDDALVDEDAPGQDAPGRGVALKRTVFRQAGAKPAHSFEHVPEVKQQFSSVNSVIHRISPRVASF